MANGIDFGTAVGLIKGLGSPDPAVIESAVNGWLDDHPEATTTVQDGSITKAKLDSNLQGTVDDVADLKSALNNSLDVSSFGWEIGTMNPGSGIEETSDTRIRSDYVSVTQGTTIKITGNPNCLIVYSFDENKGYLADTTWSSINNSFTVPNGVYYVRLLIRVSVSNQTITSDDIETQYNRCSIALILPQKVYYLPAEVDEINGDITDLYEITTKTTMPTFEWTSGGYIDAYGHVNSSPSYSYSDFMPVNGGDLLEGNMRFVTAYDANQSALPTYFGNDVSSYTVAMPVKYVRITRSTVYISQPLYKTSFTKQNKAFSKITNLGTVCNGVQGIRKTGTLSDGSLEFHTYAAIRKGKTYSFYGKVTTFNDLIIGCGTNDVNSSSIEIDTTNIKFINASTIINTTAHGLTFSGYIYVIVDIDGNAFPNVVIYTNGGTFQKTYTDEWIGASTRAHADADETTTLTGCTLTFSAADVKKTIWYCGDSYMAVRDPGKLPSKLKYFDVFKNINSIGYSGAGSQDVLPYILAMFEMDLSPKYLIWAIGMNDADTNSAVNSRWKSGYDILTRLANNGNFELVLATIPNTPTINNNYKNAIVRASGYRYIDFADAVQTAEGENTWISGMLSSDNVHPTAEGAKALASRLCADFPEIFN